MAGGTTSPHDVGWDRGGSRPAQASASRPPRATIGSARLLASSRVQVWKARMSWQSPGSGASRCAPPIVAHLRVARVTPGGAFESADLPDPPGDKFVWPARSNTDQHGTTTWTWLHAPRAKPALGFWRNRMNILLPSAGGAETVVDVTVRRGVPVTVRRADVRRLIVERPAPKETRVWSSPAEMISYETGPSAGDRYWRGGRVQSNS